MRLKGGLGTRLRGSGYEVKRGPWYKVKGVWV